MGMKELSDVLKRTSDIEKHLKPARDGFAPNLKTINRSVDFQIWKTELKRELQRMKQDPLVVDILQLLDNGFKNGFTDEKDFIDLKGKLSVLSSHLDDYFEVQTEPNAEGKKMKKGTVVKTAFDEYTLIEQVGSGGNGRVFSATNGNSDSVAIKFVERDIEANKLKRFKNEIHFCERHGNKNIVEILDRGYVTLNNTEYVFYVMPLYTETLRDKMKAKIKPEDAVTIFTGLIAGLGFAHKLGAIHRDIKPENIMFKADSLEPIICDFGIAHFAEEELLTIIETKKGDRMANFQYAAPEQRVKGEAATAQTDIYAAALILNEMFTGEIPQAADHKTIASVAPEYAFLDDVFGLMFKQKPLDRLYPAEKILTELKVRAEQYKREQQKLELQKIIDEVTDPGAFVANIAKKEYLNGRLVFTLDRKIPYEWFQFISNGRLGGYSSVMGYEPSKVEKEGDYAISMRLRGTESEDTIKRIVTNIVEWVSKANGAYTSYLKRVAQVEQQRREGARKAEIARLDRESAIGAILAQL